MDKMRYILIEPRSEDRARISYQLTQDGHYVQPFADIEESKNSIDFCDIVLVRNVRGLIEQMKDAMDELGCWRPIVAIDAFDETNQILSVLAKGAVDCVNIAQPGEEMHRQISTNCIHWFDRWQERALKRRDRRLLDCLTKREMDVVREMARGLSNKEIARKLDISPRTVEVHRANAITKTGLGNSVRLAIAGTYLTAPDYSEANIPSAMQTN